MIKELVASIVITTILTSTLVFIVWSIYHAAGLV